MTNLIGAAYKWRINNNVYSYITSAESDGPFISSGSTVCNEELIRSKVQNFTEGEYETKFNEMVTYVHTYDGGKYSYVQFLDYTIYMNEVEHCDIYNRPDVVTDIDIAVCSTTLPSDSGATVEITSTDEDDIECRDGEKIRKYHINFGIPMGQRGSRFIPISVTDEELSNNEEQIIRENDILDGDFVVSVDTTTIWYCEDNKFINSGVKLNRSAYRYNEVENAYSFGEEDNAGGKNSITEGYGTETSGKASHAEGFGNIAEGNYSHVEGCENEAIGVGSHAEGFGNIAEGDYSHVEGRENIAKNPYSTVIGIYAKEDDTNKKIFQVGCGTGPGVNERRDFFAVNSDGTFIFSNSEETKTLSLSDFETVKFQSSISETDPKYNYKNGDLIFDEKDLYLLKQDKNNSSFEPKKLTHSVEIEKLNGDIADLNGEIADLNGDITDLYEQIDNVTATPQFMVGTVVMWPSIDAPSGWLPCDGNTIIPNDNGEGEELIKILKRTYPNQYPEGEDKYYTPNYLELFTKNDTYSDLFLNFIIYTGASVKNCVESINGVTYDITDMSYKGRDDDSGILEYTAIPLTTLANTLSTSTKRHFAIWLGDDGTEPLISVEITGNTQIHNLTFSLTNGNIGELIEGRTLCCGFMANNTALNGDYLRGSWRVKIIIPSETLNDLRNENEKDILFTMNVKTNITYATSYTEFSFIINDFVKQICN